MEYIISVLLCKKFLYDLFLKENSKKNRSGIWNRIAKFFVISILKWVSF